MSTELYVTLIADNLLTDSGLIPEIDAEKDDNYWKCVDSYHIPASFNPTNSNSTTDPIQATCVAKGGTFDSCGYDNTDFAIYFYVNGDQTAAANQVGWCHFYKPPGEDWKSGSVGGDTYYSVSIKDDDAAEGNKYTVTIRPAPVSLSITMAASSTLSAHNLADTISAALDTSYVTNLVNPRATPQFGSDTASATATTNISDASTAAEMGIVFTVPDADGQPTELGYVHYAWDPSTTTWTVAQVHVDDSSGYSIYAPAEISTGVFAITIDPG